MQVTATQLNEVAALLGTNDKQVVISAVLRGMVEMGVDVADAFDAVFGAGAFRKFAGQVYNALRGE